MQIDLSSIDLRSIDLKSIDLSSIGLSTRLIIELRPIDIGPVVAYV